MYYLFHQPLHFITAAYILRFEYLLSLSNHIALEGLQYLSLFYVSATTILFLLILRELKIRTLTLYSLLIFFTFNPTLTLFSGYISDDTSVLFWSILVIYFIIKWYKKDNLKYLCFAAISLGLGTLTKLSILMLTPAISFLFLCKFLSTKDKRLCIFQISTFIIIAVPLALSWIIRNHVLFDMQFFNIPDTSPAGQNFRELSLYNRLFDTSNLFTIFISAPSISDNNILLSLVKTELFGEWDLSITASYIKYPAAVLYALNIALKIFIFGIASSILFNYFTKKSINIFYPFFAIMYLTIFIYSIKYSIDFPYVCSSDFRLFAQINIAELIILGYPIYTLKTNKLLMIGAICYALLSTFIYSAILL
jgi:4-amino-4-deoxy-L-arabinose transferase-like glycosyltransferase